MWILIVTGPLGFWYSAWRQRSSVSAICFATALTMGLVPGVLGDVNRGELVGGEAWFPIALAFLVGLSAAPGINRLGQVWARARAT
jgi:hypothetical protein